MRVLHVYSGNLFGGIESILVTIARARATCPDLTHEFALCFEGRLQRELEATGVRVHPLAPVRLSAPLTARAARLALGRVLQANTFDRMICHAPWTQAIFGGVAHRAGVPLVFWAHDVMTGCHWTERLAKRVTPDLVICNSRFTETTLSRLYRDVPHEVVYAPVEGSPRAVNPGQSRRLRASLQTPEQAVVVIQVSRSEPWKGHALILEALAALRDVPDWIWWQVGGAQRPAEETFLSSLRELAVRNGIGDRVRWLGDRTDVRDLLAAADIHCQANLAPESFGMTFVEALAAGLPVVTTDLGGAREILDDTCGLLLKPRDVAALAEALGRLIGDRAFRAQLSSGARERARRLCDAGTQIRRLYSVLSAMPAGVEA